MDYSLNLLEGLSCNGTLSCPTLYECVNDACVHKSPFPPTQREIIGSILIVFFGGLANAGGMGGTFAILPILVTIFNYDPIPAIRTVYGMVFAGAVGNFLTTGFTREKITLKPLINYNMCLICIPMLLCGASLGVIIKSYLPPVITITGLELILFNNIYKINKRAKSQYAQETTANNQLKSDLLEKGGQEIELTPIDYQQHETIMKFPRALAIMREERNMFPRKKYQEIFMLLICMMALLVLRGNKTFSSIIGVEFCQSGYWMIYFLALGVCFYFGLRAKAIVLGEVEMKRQIEGESVNKEQGMNLTSENITALSTTALVGGILAGMIGIGGGMIIGPTMLDIGMNGQTTTATCGFFILFTSFISLFQTLLAGEVNLIELVFFASLSSIGALAVSKYLLYLVRKYNRPSIMLFSLVYAMCVGAMIIPSYAALRTVQEPELMLSVGQLC